MKRVNKVKEPTNTAIGYEPLLAPVVIHWIPISERLPDYSGDYLVAYTSSSKHITIAYFVDLENIFYHKWTKGAFKSITHWASLPKAPTI